MSRWLGPVRQIGYVVPDVEKAMRYWLDVMGVGPFFTLPTYPVYNYESGGRPTEPLLSVGIAYSGPLQIELIQPLGDTPSYYRELCHEEAETSRPSYVTYWTRSFAADLDRAMRAGCVVVQSGGQEGAGKFAYLRRPGGPLFEILETSDFIEAWFAGMQAVASEWDGSNPIRPAMP